MKDGNITSSPWSYDVDESYRRSERDYVDHDG